MEERVVELLKIRHRIGHCRRPHVDDLSRLEQTLRHLDSGAFRALTAFNRQWEPERSLDDPLVKAWVRNEHTAAARLVEHADRQDEVRFNLLTHIGLGPREYRSTPLSRATAAIYGMPVGFWPEDTSICEPSGKTIAWRAAET
jgi:hypothetical protein